MQLAVAVRRFLHKNRMRTPIAEVKGRQSRPLGKVEISSWTARTVERSAKLVTLQQRSFKISIWTIDPPQKRTPKQSTLSGLLEVCCLSLGSSIRAAGCRGTGTPPGQAFQTQLKCDFHCRNVACATCATALRCLAASRFFVGLARPRDFP
jgi:hypothetical protein